VARAIHQHFQGLGYDAFLDTEDEAIEPGEEVQPRIVQAIPERDFLPLIDSPDAAEDSEWAREAVTISLENRVALFSVRIGGTDGFLQVRGLPSIEWHDDIDSKSPHAGTLCRLDTRYAPVLRPSPAADARQARTHLPTADPRPGKAPVAAALR